MRVISVLSCALLALPAAGRADTSASMPWDAAVRCAAAAERMPQATRTAVALAREAAQAVPSARAGLPALEQSAEEAGPAMDRLAAQTRAQALAAVGGDPARLEQELAEARRGYPVVDGPNHVDPQAFKAFVTHMESEMRQCEVAKGSAEARKAG